jgi:hypothetical protein
MFQDDQLSHIVDGFRYGAASSSPVGIQLWKEGTTILAELYVTRLGTGGSATALA